MSSNKFPLPGEEYLHYKGGTYRVISLATHSETDEKLVVYESINFGSVFVRPLSMWSEEVKNPNNFGFATVLRFEKIIKE